MKIVAISDLHGKWNKIDDVPECDVLISSGDFSFKGEKHMVKDYHKWLNRQKAQYIISGNGNHETYKDVCSPARNFYCDITFAEAKEIAEKECPRVNFIGDHGTVVIDGVKFHHSSITPWFHDWAWNRYRGMEIEAEWKKIPDDVNVLSTHGPVYGILDAVYYVDGMTIKERVGCQDLYKRILELKECNLHICGHIHGAHGYKYFNDTHFYNVAICDEMYMPTNPITVINYEKRKLCLENV